MKKAGMVAVLALLIAGFGFGDAVAQSSLGFKGVGGRVGYLDADGLDGGTIVFGGHVHLGEIIPQLALVPSIDYAKKSQDVGTVEVDISAISINGDVRYYIPTGGNVDVFAEGGLAWVRSKADAGQFGDQTESEIGLNLGGGAEIALSDNLVGTAMLIYVTEGEQLKIMGGVTFMLGK